MIHYTTIPQTVLERTPAAFTAATPLPAPVSARRNGQTFLANADKVRELNNFLFVRVQFADGDVQWTNSDNIVEVVKPIMLQPVTTTVQLNTTLEVGASFQNHLVTGDSKNQGEWHRCLSIARELKVNQLWDGTLPLHICGNVSEIHHQISFHEQMPHIQVITGCAYCYLNEADIPVEIPVTANAAAATVGSEVTHVAPSTGVGGEVNPAYYLDQKFQWTTEDGTVFNCTVQAWNERRQQFRLYEPRGGCWYREPEFVYAHCQPSAQPVVREPLPTIAFDPRRYWNLVSLSAKRQYIAADVQATGIPQADPLLRCECCGQPLVIIGKQIWSPKMNREDSILVECQNDTCIAHRRTATTASHAQICEDAKKEQQS